MIPEPKEDWRLRSAAIDDVLAAGFDEMGCEEEAEDRRRNAAMLRQEVIDEAGRGLIQWRPSLTVSNGGKFRRPR